VTRLCYCGPVLHTRAAMLRASREPLQFGAELFGHAGLEADLEVQELALDCLQLAGFDALVIDLADARVLRGVLAGAALDAGRLTELAQALAQKDAATVAALSGGLAEPTRRALQALLRLYGGAEVLAAAREALPARALTHDALDQLDWLARHLASAYPSLSIGFDLSDMSGYAYYSGARFAIYGAESSDALARGGRYDEVGAVFGRNRPAVGFSLDLKALADAADAASGIAAVRRLRERGETVLAVLPGHEVEARSIQCDRELAAVDGRWVLRALPASPETHS
jgi:ATP phosphoribosyltransferase regulatory subunit